MTKRPLDSAEVVDKGAVSRRHLAGLIVVSIALPFLASCKTNGTPVKTPPPQRHDGGPGGN